MNRKGVERKKSRERGSVRISELSVWTKYNWFYAVPLWQPINQVKLWVSSIGHKGKGKQHCLNQHSRTETCGFTLLNDSKPFPKASSQTFLEAMPSFPQESLSNKESPALFWHHAAHTNYFTHQGNVGSPGMESGSYLMKGSKTSQQYRTKKQRKLYPVASRRKREILESRLEQHMAEYYANHHGWDSSTPTTRIT